MVKRLLLDRHHFACRGDAWKTDGEFEIKLGETTKIGPVFAADQPWERWHLNWLTVLRDNGKYRMWYEAFSDPADNFGCRLCYAESDDMLHWHKPHLGVCTFEGSTENNIVIETSADQVRIELAKWALSTNETAAENAKAEAKKAEEAKAKAKAAKKAEKAGK